MTIISTQNKEDYQWFFAENFLLFEKKRQWAISTIAANPPLI
jgi:hypothetical protein